MLRLARSMLNAAVNKTVSLDFWVSAPVQYVFAYTNTMQEARLGYNPLIYVDGWPVAQ